MINLKIIDDTFAHCQSASSQVGEVPVNWDRNVDINDDLVFYTKNFTNPTFGKIKIALLLEPYDIIPQLYTELLNNYNKFDYILTHDLRLLQIGPKFIFLPVGGQWVNEYSGNKTENLSIIASSKTWMVGHKLRHQIIHKYRNE